MDDKINQHETGKINPKKRVLFVITQSEFGGAQRFLSQLLNNLNMDKFEYAVVAGTDGNKEIKNILPQNTHYITSKYLHRNPSIFNDILSVFELKKIIMSFQPDALFLNSSKAGFNGSLAVKLLPHNLPRPSVVYRIGGWAFNDPWPRWKQLVYCWLEKISATWKNYIIVNNRYDYDQAIRFGIKPKKGMILIYNGIDPYKLNFIEKDEAKIRLYELSPQKYGSFWHNGLIIGTIANFYPTKGLQYLIRAMHILNNKYKALNSTLVIVGDGQERQNLESIIKNLELENMIFLAGRTYDAYRYLKAFDIFTLPSIKEGFPWALLEAMSAKLPAIATAVGANSEIIENEKNGLLVPPADPQALAEAMKKLIDNEPMRRELGIQAHQTILHKFTLNKMVLKTEALLSNEN